MKRLSFLVLVPVVAALVIAGCGGGSGGKAGPGGHGATVSLKKLNVGTALVDGHRYAADTKAGEDAGQALDQFGAEWYVVGASGSKIDNG